jgi:serine protease Do
VRFARLPSARLPFARTSWLLLAVLVLAPGPVYAQEKPLPALITRPKNADDLRAIEAQVKQVVAKVLPSVVGVRIGAGQGSGVIVSEDGLILTAGHVINRPNLDAAVLFPDGRTAKAKTLGLYKSADAGLMKITDQGKWPFLEKGKSADLLPGTWCIALGHPFGFLEGRPPVVRIGRILQAKDSMIQTDCPLIAGDSGGPLFDLAGRVIGINSRIGGPTSMNFHVAVDVFTENWARLLKGDEWDLAMEGRDSGEVKAVFRPLVAEAARCVVRVKCDGKETALGTIVGPNGWIVTKASELTGKIACQMRDGKELPAQIVGLCPQFDLAMLKVEAGGLPAIGWSQDYNPAVGQWVAAAGMQDDPLAVGVVSVPRRKIPPPSGMLGIVLEDGKTGPLIRQVLPKSPAEKVGLKPSDVITHVNDQAVKDRAQLIKMVKEYRPGQAVKLSFKRGEQKMELSVTLGLIDTPETQKKNLQNASGVGLSKRHDDFPLVLQHDTVLRPVDCGGPLVDLSGRVLGVNVARGGRTETYTVPVDALIVLMYDMMSGRLPPPKTEAEKKAEADKAAAEKAAAEKAAAEKAAAEKAAAEKAASEKAAKEKAEAEKKAAQEKAEAEKKAAEQKAAQEKAAEQAKSQPKPAPQPQPAPKP